MDEIASDLAIDILLSFLQFSTDANGSRRFPVYPLVRYCFTTSRGGHSGEVEVAGSGLAAHAYSNKQISRVSMSQL